MAARNPMSRRAGVSPRRLVIDDRGYANLARQIRSPNRDARPSGTFVTLVVIHGISLPPGEFGGDAIARLFTNRLDPMAHPYYASIAHLHVSSHFLVRRDGRLVQFVSCNERAWHAGISRFRGRAHCNDFSIGVELEGTDHLPYEAAQYAMLVRLLKALARRYPIRHVAGHSDIAPERKTDPGPAFDWARLRRLTYPRR
jgi:AmpD protein